MNCPPWAVRLPVQQRQMQPPALMLLFPSGQQTETHPRRGGRGKRQGSPDLQIEGNRQQLGRMTQKWSGEGRGVPEGKCHIRRGEVGIKDSRLQNQTLCHQKLTVHFHQQLVQGLLLFCVGEARHVCRAPFPNRVYFVYVNDARSTSPGFLEETPHPGSAKACRRAKRGLALTEGLSRLRPREGDGALESFCSCCLGRSWLSPTKPQAAGCFQPGGVSARGGQQGSHPGSLASQGPRATQSSQRIWGCSSRFLRPETVEEQEVGSR